MQPSYFGRRGRYLPYIGMFPGIFLFVLFGLGPSLFTVVFSFTDISGTPGTPWHFIGAANYAEFFHYLTIPDNDNIAMLERTFLFCGAVTVIQNTLALFLAIILNTRLKGHLFYRSLIFLPTILGVTVVGLIWSLVLNPLDGPGEAFLSLFHTRSDFFSSPSQAFTWVIFVQIWMSIGTSVVIFLAGLQTIPSDLYDAVRIDGASSWQRFRSLIYPLMAPSITVNVIFAIIGSLQSFQIIYVLTGGNFHTSVLSFEIFQTAFSLNNNLSRQGYASMLSMIQFVLVLVVVLIFQGYLRRREVQL